jgi:DinB superfamily
MRNAADPPTAGLVSSACQALQRQQRRVAGYLTVIDRHGGWQARLSDRAAARLVTQGHFPDFAAELAWSPREVAGHLRDSAVVFAERLRRLRYEPRPWLADFDSVAPSRIDDYRSTPTPLLLDQLRGAQQLLRSTIAALPEAALERHGTLQLDGPVTIASILEFLPAHQHDHADQLGEYSILADLGHRPYRRKLNGHPNGLRAGDP